MRRADREIQRLRDTWDGYARSDPLWTVVAAPGMRGRRWREPDFYETGRREIAEVMGRMEEVAHLGQRKRALDFGCGVGRLTEALGEHFERVDGVDISEAMIQQARAASTHSGPCAYHVNVGADLSLFQDATFDLVYSNIVLQHLGRALATRYLREFVRVLRPGGVLNFQLPTSRRWNLRGLVVRLAPARLQEHIRGMRMEGMPDKQVRRWLEGMDLVIVEVAVDGSAGDQWHSRRYIGAKPRPAPVEDHS
ncbi:MAG: class I SAM-dependent methyltransferase [Acidimicrobiaceae bacterium]|nr:class I SAM-dependent methyltransferase [Acidimicrobiaceae bacterium]